MRLLVVEDAFDVAYRGSILAPRLPADQARPGPFRVELRRPDGTVLTRTATATASYTIPASAPTARVELCLVDGRKSDAPAGTEVWTVG